MNLAPSTMLSILDARAKDLLCLIEFYASDYIPDTNHGFRPPSALARFSTETCSYKHSLVDTTVSYYREALSMPSLSRNLGKQSNSCTVRFSNVSKRLAAFVLDNDVQGMFMVVRVISRAELLVGQEGCLILFVGRCVKADGFDRKDASITAKQDLGQIEAMIPPRIFQKDCPLRFKGTECLGTEVLGDKSAAYQAATICNKSFDQCTEYENEEFYQGIKIIQIQGSFLYKPHHGFLYKLIRYSSPVGYLASKLFGKKPHMVGDSIEDGTPYGSAIPVVLGRWQMPGIPLQYQDRGEAIDFLMAFARGPIASFNNTRCNTPGFTQPFSLVEHHGFYGGESDQTADAVFPEHGFFSRLAYETGYCAGSDIEVEDPVPDISSMIGGIKIDINTAIAGGGFGTGLINGGGISYADIFEHWTDNPVNLARYVLIDAALLNFGRNFIDTIKTAVTETYCIGGIKDVTNAERLILPNTESGSAGVTYKRYHTTGLLIPESFGISASSFPIPVAAKEALYEYYNPASPPTTVPVITKYRRRFTCNLGLTEQRKAIDLLYDTILPTFRGFLSWNNRGQVAIRSERPADSVMVRSSTLAGVSSIPVWDVYPWSETTNENDSPLIGKILVGVGLTTSEVRTVTGFTYSTVGNSITLAASGTGGTTATASGANFTGGSSSVKANATITITGSPTVGDIVTATIDGVDVTYTLTPGSGFGIGLTSTMACCLAFAINSDPVIGKYVEAYVNSLSNVVTLVAKVGTLTLSSPLAEAHNAEEETIRVMMSFAGKALTHANTTKANILNGSFKYLGNDGQTRYNQFKGTFHDPLRDFAEQPVVVNDYDHQDLVQKVFPLEIDLQGVDNYNQASRLLNGAAAKFGDGVDFFSWGSNGLALQLEEGDVVCLNDDSGEWINVPVRIESLTVNESFEVSFKARIYSTTMFNDEVLQTTVPLPHSTNFAEPPPDIGFNTTDFPPDGLEQSTDGSAGITSIRGGAIFGASIYSQWARVRLIKRAGVVVDELIRDDLKPNSSLEGVFEFLASAPGLYTVELEVCNQWGCNTTKPTADIVIVFAFGALNALSREVDGSLLLREQGEFLEREY